jgi:hypothetical protein
MTGRVLKFIVSVATAKGKRNGATSIYLVCWVLESPASSRNPRLATQSCWLPSYSQLRSDHKEKTRRIENVGCFGPVSVVVAVPQEGRGGAWTLGSRSGAKSMESVKESKRNASGRRPGRMFGSQTLALGTDVCAAGVAGERKTGNDEAEGRSNGPVSLLPRQPAHHPRLPVHRGACSLFACLLASSLLP